MFSKGQVKGFDGKYIPCQPFERQCSMVASSGLYWEPQSVGSDMLKAPAVGTFDCRWYFSRLVILKDLQYLNIGLHQ